MIVNDQTHPTATLDMLAQVESKMKSIKPFEALSLDGRTDEGVNAPRGFDAFTDEHGRKMFRIPWGAEIAALQKALKAQRRAYQNAKAGLATGHWAMVRLAKKKRRKMASASLRRNYA